MTQNQIRTYSSDESLVNERRDLIRREATKLFVRQGYSRTTMRQIAEACGLKHGTLYHYIGGKADILQLILRLQPELLHSMEALIKQLDGLSYKEMLKRVILKHLTTADEWHDYMTFLGSERGIFQADDFLKLRKDIASGLRLIEEVIAKGVEAGEFHTDDPLWVAYTIHEYGTSWVGRAWLVRKLLTFEEYIQKVTETAFRLLGVDTK